MTYVSTTRMSLDLGPCSYINDMHTMIWESESMYENE